MAAETVGTGASRGCTRAQGTPTGPVVSRRHGHRYCIPDDLLGSVENHLGHRDRVMRPAAVLVRFNR